MAWRIALSGRVIVSLRKSSSISFAIASSPYSGRVNLVGSTCLSSVKNKSGFVYGFKTIKKKGSF